MATLMYNFYIESLVVWAKLICFQQESHSFKQVCCFVKQVGGAQRVKIAENTINILENLDFSAVS